MQDKKWIDNGRHLRDARDTANVLLGRQTDSLWQTLIGYTGSHSAGNELNLGAGNFRNWADPGLSLLTNRSTIPGWKGANESHPSGPVSDLCFSPNTRLIRLLGEGAIHQNHQYTNFYPTIHTSPIIQRSGGFGPESRI
jgi:hypothetical protein